MKKAFFTLLFFSLNSFAGLNSSFIGTVEGLDTPNSHIVGDSYLIRGQAPRSLKEYEQLKEIGIDSVVIFKNQTKIVNKQTQSLLNILQCTLASTNTSRTQLRDLFSESVDRATSSNLSLRPRNRPSISSDFDIPSSLSSFITSLLFNSRF